ncbi:MAG: hypothetical protein HJHJAOHD_00446 [Flavobacteriales bacterium]|nr:hypothetical protein [Flavobacteriales bacterium]
MRLKRYFSCFLIVSFLLLFFSCNKDSYYDDCTEYVETEINSIEGPEVIKKEQKAVFKIVFSVYNGCGNFESFKERKNKNTYEISVIAKYKGCLCTMNIPEIRTEYFFRPRKKGTYYLNFKAINNTVISKTLIVE